jgi:hypothetical protein
MCTHIHIHLSFLSTSRKLDYFQDIVAASFKSVSVHWDMKLAGMAENDK